MHHVGLSDDKRLRGHTSLLGAIDVQILCERKDGVLSATLTLQKLKDEASGIKLTAHFSRVVIGYDEDGEEVSTLVVDAIEDAATQKGESRPKPVPRTQRLLMAVVSEAIEVAGEIFRPFADGPSVRAVCDGKIRSRYYARIADKAEPDEDPKKLMFRQRKAFNRALEAALVATTLVAGERNGERLIWFP